METGPLIPVRPSLFSSSSLLSVERIHLRFEKQPYVRFFSFNDAVDTVNVVNTVNAVDTENTTIALNTKMQQIL